MSWSVTSVRERNGFRPLHHLIKFGVNDMADRAELRRANKHEVYMMLLRQGKMPVQKISVLTGISIPTVTQHLNSLIEEGAVRILEERQTTGGRMAREYQCITDAKYAMGIDITQNHLTIAVLDLAGEVVGILNRIQFNFEDKPECYKEIVARARKLLIENSIASDKILGVGLSLPCIVDYEANRVVYSKVVDVPADISERFKKATPYEITVFNDANSAGYAEMYFRNGQEDTYSGRNLFYLMLSNSVGGASLYDGKIILGDDCRSAEIGHTKLVPKGKKCYCGQRGCVNAYCNAKNLADHTDGNLEEFFKRMEQGDAQLKKAFNDYLDYLAITVVNLRMVYDCDIILGGYVGGQMEAHMDELKKKVKKLDPYDESPDFLKPCVIKREASAVGAALSFISDYIDNI